MAAAAALLAVAPLLLALPSAPSTGPPPARHATPAFPSTFDCTTTTTTTTTSTTTTLPHHHHNHNHHNHHHNHPLQEDAAGEEDPDDADVDWRIFSQRHPLTDKMQKIADSVRRKEIKVDNLRRESDRILAKERWGGWGCVWGEVVGGRGGGRGGWGEVVGVVRCGGLMDWVVGGGWGW